MNYYELFDRCNHTELYQFAREAGHNVQPNWDRDSLIRVIIGDVEPPNAEHDIDEWRLALMRFVIDHRTTLESQLTCPAKTMDPRACFNCVDAQVIACLVENKQYKKLIQIHRKK